MGFAQTPVTVVGSSEAGMVFLSSPSWNQECTPGVLTVDQSWA